MKSALTQIPTSNGHISETKQDFLDPLVPKFFSRRGLSPTLSWKTALSPSFGQQTHFFGVVQVCVAVCLWSEYAPGPVFQVGKKNYLATHSLAGRVKFVISFVEVFSLICTQTAWKRMYIASVTKRNSMGRMGKVVGKSYTCLLYTSDAADE